MATRKGNVPLSVGDAVSLLIEDVVVANGLIFRTGTNDVCHSVMLGSHRIAIFIQESILGNKALPVPHIGAETIEECVGSYAIWPLDEIYSISINTTNSTTENDLLIVTDHPMPQMEFAEQEVVLDSQEGNLDLPNDKEDECDEVVHEPDRAPSTINVFDRGEWYMMNVDLYSHDAVTLLGYGTITLPRPDAAINNEKVGEDHVGVLILDLICGIDSSIRKNELPHYVEGCPCLVRWPIMCVKISGTDQFLGEILKEGYDKHDCLAIEDMPKNKRAYNNKTRKKADPEAKRRKEEAKRRATKLSSESINSVSSICCCPRDCCRFMRRDAITLARYDYYGLPSNERIGHVMDTFRMREASVIAAGKMIFDNKVVCKEAFWNAYGFKRSSFFSYQAQYEEGVRIGFHGNKGKRKTWSHTIVARAFLNQMLVDMGEPMPHLPYTGKKGTTNIVYKLPSCYNKASMFLELHDSMSVAGVKPISKATFYSLWNLNFANYSFHKRSAFAKCKDCISLKARLMKEKVPEKRVELEEEREVHNNGQMSRRHLYYANRILAQKYPDRYLSIIHDKMDQQKTGLPKMVNALKSMTSGCIALPMALTGMLIHGRNPGIYGHFSLTGLWPSDADFTCTSVAKCLCDLEVYSGDKSGDLAFFPDENTKPLFKALLQQEAFTSDYLSIKKITIDRYKGNPSQLDESIEGSSSSASSTSFKPLPKHFMLQMDNSWKDNKNQIVFAFCSELVLRGIFQTVQVSFLMVGHTHEDVDAFFSKVAGRIGNRDVTTFPALMAEMWECQSIHPVPYLIREVADYHEYVKDFVLPMVGQSRPIAFLFSMKDNVPVYQYKENLHDMWLPIQGRKIWKQDELTKLTLHPQGEPKAKKMFNFHKRALEIIPYLNHYIGWLKSTWKDEESEGHRQMVPLLSYWETIRHLLSNALCNSTEPGVLAQGFWPRTNHGTGFKAPLQCEEVREDTTNDAELVQLQNELTEELLERDQIFVGDPREKEKYRFIPLEDIKCGRFIVLRPNDEFEKEAPGCFWVVRAITSVVENSSSPNNGKFQIEWWRPKNRSKKASNEERYADCLNPNKTWERDPLYAQDEVHWMEGGASIYFWVTRDNIVPKVVKVPLQAIEAIEDMLSRIHASEGNDKGSDEEE